MAKTLQSILNKPHADLEFVKFDQLPDGVHKVKHLKITQSQSMFGNTFRGIRVEFEDVYGATCYTFLPSYLQKQLTDEQVSEMACFTVSLTKASGTLRWTVEG